MDICRMARARGLKIGKSQIWNLIRNPIYCGSIFVPAYKDEKAVVIKAVHEPIISAQLFDDVQDLLNGKKRKFPARNTLKEELPLRGYLYCLQCGSKLTGSASKGNGGRYFYYHCQHGCKERFKAELANNKLLEKLYEIKANPGVVRALQKNLEVFLSSSKAEKAKLREVLNAELDKEKTRLSTARNMMLDGTLDAAEYKEIKNQYEVTIKKT
jgi:site-specific DNA recombinase